uniref:cytochrome-c oxidase n=1 Tax=Diplostomum ardeae TaxID=1702217 RepID=A0A6M8P262_9TREM|nr:cytochrome c oxidase subunit II [Diplostomum ardeae]QKG04353.1 cytochrome c oxidase subunit II [Diplostomum ardeae]
MLFSSNYYDLIIYTYFLSFVIPAWVFIMVGCNIYCGRYSITKLSNESFWTEFCWTMVPYILVFVMCYLNMQFIGEGEDLFDVSHKAKVVKVVGHQWYWSYEDWLYGGVFYDSMMTDFVGEVDKPLRVGYGTPHKFVVTSVDVIHSFALPDFSIKLDAVPGRLTSQLLLPDRCGIFIGYCSELCGAGHAYMPIVMEIVKLDKEFKI